MALFHVPNRRPEAILSFNRRVQLLSSQRMPSTLFSNVRKTLLFFAVALLSHGCTTVCYDSLVPDRRMSLFVTDEAGQPLPQARLVVETKVFKSPKEGLPSTEEGRIDLVKGSVLNGA